MIKTICHLISNNNIIRDEPTWDKSTLVLRDQVRHDELQPVCKHLRCDLVQDIRQANRPQMTHFLRLVNLRDQCNVGEVNLLQNFGTC